MARPKWNPNRPNDDERWRAATGLLNRVDACQKTFESIDGIAPKELSDPGAILDAFLRVRREALKEEASAWEAASGAEMATRWLADQPEHQDSYIEGFRWAALHVAEYRRAKKKREPRLDPKGHAIAMAAAIAAGHDYRKGLPDLNDTRLDHLKGGEAARKLFQKAGARYRKGPEKK